MRLGIESLVRDETSVVDTVEQALEVIDGLPSDGCGPLVDNYHANVKERDVPNALSLAGDRLVHVHLRASDRADQAG